MSEPIHDPADASLAEKLTAYAPRPPRIDRDQLMFEAGRAAAAVELSSAPGPRSQSPSRWFWPASTLAMSALSLALTAVLITRPDPPERIVYVPTEPGSTQVVDEKSFQAADVPTRAKATGDSPALTLASLPDNHPLKLRQIALTEGVDALVPAVTDSAPRMTPPLSRGALLQRLSAPPRADQPQPGLFRWPAWLMPQSTM